MALPVLVMRPAAFIARGVLAGNQRDSHQLGGREKVEVTEFGDEGGGVGGRIPATPSKPTTGSQRQPGMAGRLPRRNARVSAFGDAIKHSKAICWTGKGSLSLAR